MQVDEQEQKFDFRVYIGVILFRWQIIALCFLYSLLAGILYIHLSPKTFMTTCRILIYKDPNLVLSKGSGPFRSKNIHQYLLSSEKLRSQTVDLIEDDWAERMGGKRNLMLGVEVVRGRRMSGTLVVSVKSRRGDYGKAFLSTLLDEHEKEWGSIQRRASANATKVLDSELGRLEEEIRKAEDDLVEYVRINDMTRVKTEATMEARYLSALMERRSQLSTELMLLESQNPFLKNADASTISSVAELTRGTREVAPVPDETTGPGGESVSEPPRPRLPEGLMGADDAQLNIEERRGWHDMKVKLAQLEKKEIRLVADLLPSHPEVVAVRRQIFDIEDRLEVAAKIELGKLKDRQETLKMHIKAIETAEYRWSAKSMLASQRKAEFKRISAVGGRYENNYQTLYARKHDMQVTEELKAEYFERVEPVATSDRPVWPDPIKIMLAVLAVGLGSGFGIALLAQTLDNKVQTISDVVTGLGVPFLGGVPFWVHGGLETSVRPIVTEEHSTGAVEAYRALRTSVLAELKKLNEKIVFVTSADSREGKTLTSLNMAILVAQMGKKVLLVDMDLRRGRLHRSLGVEKEPGMTEVLSSTQSFSDVIRPSRIENLSLAPTGGFIDNSAELLQSSDVSQIFAEVQDDYDFILIDTSPVLRATDTVILASQGFGVVVYVARVNRTPKPLIRYSLDMLKDAHVIGMILNSIEMHRISSLYYTYQYPNYAYYSNAYAYGYNYYDYGDGTAGMGGGKRQRNRRQSERSLVQWFKRTFLPME